MSGFSGNNNQSTYFTRSYQPTGQYVAATSGPGSYYRKNANTNYMVNQTPSSQGYGVYSQQQSNKNYASMNRGYGGRRSRRSRRSRRTRRTRISKRSRKSRKH
jgi:hypothetical protein